MRVCSSVYTCACVCAFMCGHTSVGQCACECWCVLCAYMRVCVFAYTQVCVSVYVCSIEPYRPQSSGERNTKANLKPVDVPEQHKPRRPEKIKSSHVMSSLFI